MPIAYSIRRGPASGIPAVRKTLENASLAIQARLPSLKAPKTAALVAATKPHTIRTYGG